MFNSGPIDRKLEDFVKLGVLFQNMDGSCVDNPIIHGLISMPSRYEIQQFQSNLFPNFKTPEQGAQTTIYCAVAEEMDCAIKEPSKGAQDDDAARELWDLSLKLVGLEK